MSSRRYIRLIWVDYCSSLRFVSELDQAALQNSYLDIYSDGCSESEVPFLGELGIHYFEFPSGPEHKEERLKYTAEVKQSQGYDVTSFYGRLTGGICPVIDLSDPSLQDIVRFAVQEYNKYLPSDEHLRLVSTVRFNFKPRGIIYHYITLKAEDPSGNENCYRALVYTCWEGCKWLGEFGLAPSANGLPAGKEIWENFRPKKWNREVNTLKMIKNEDGSSTSVALVEDEKRRKAQERGEYVKAYEARSCRHRCGLNTPSYVRC